MFGEKFTTNIKIFDNCSTNISQKCKLKLSCKVIIFKIIIYSAEELFHIILTCICVSKFTFLVKLNFLGNVIKIIDKILQGKLNIT